MYKTLQEVPVIDLETYYNQIEEILYDEAYIAACELISPNSPEFDDLQLKLEENMIEEAMIRQFIGTNPIKGQL